MAIHEIYETHKTEENVPLDLVLRLTDEEGFRCYFAQFRSSVYKRFCDMSEVEIASNHIARDRGSLLSEMLDHYPDLQPEDYVTIIGFDIPELV